MAIIPAVAVVTIAGAGATLWRIGRRIPPLDLIMVARATGSPRACLGFVRFCLEQRSEDR